MMDSNVKTIFKESVVIGAGISGIAVAKWLKYYNREFIVIEKSNDIAGLWRYREDDYGVMEFTHINVSKYNYCYSDHSFPSQSIDFPHHSDMYKYVKSYVEKNDLISHIKFNHEVKEVNETNSSDPLLKQFSSLDLSKKIWKIQVKDLITNETFFILTYYLSIASGHHGLPLNVTFPGQDTFAGDIFHSVRYKSATVNKVAGKRVLVVGIGNSAVDILTNLYNEGRCQKVVCSTRSGAWIIPNYIHGFATDLYACRLFLRIPWKIGSFIMEAIIKFIYGSPEKYNLNPKMRALSAQPTVSPTLIHHLQRNYIQIKPNVRSISGSDVTFENGEVDSFDTIIMCTGYKIGLDFLHPDLKNVIFKDADNSILNLFKGVFHPALGSSLGFIGFAQPQSGGLLTISEIQARWFVHLMMNDTKLPSEQIMKESIDEDIENAGKRFHNSSRHTIQQDPILYNDEVSSYFGSKPDFFKNIMLFWRLMFSSCGPAQWRLNGPEAYSGATKMVKSVPITTLMNLFGYMCIGIMAAFSFVIIPNPFIILSVGLLLSIMSYLFCFASFF